MVCSMYIHVCNCTYFCMDVNICMDTVQTRLYSFTTTLHFPSGPISRTGARQPHQAGRSLQRPPALGARAGATKGGREGVVKRIPRPKADAD